MECEKQKENNIWWNVNEKPALSERRRLLYIFQRKVLGMKRTASRDLEEFGDYRVDQRIFREAYKYTKRVFTTKVIRCLLLACLPPDSGTSVSDQDVSDSDASVGDKKVLEKVLKKIDKMRELLEELKFSSILTSEPDDKVLLRCNEDKAQCFNEMGCRKKCRQKPKTCEKCPALWLYKNLDNIDKHYVCNAEDYIELSGLTEYVNNVENTDFLPAIYGSLLIQLTKEEKQLVDEVYDKIGEFNKEDGEKIDSDRMIEIINECERVLEIRHKAPDERLAYIKWYWAHLRTWIKIESRQWSGELNNYWTIESEKACFKQLEEASDIIQGLVLNDEKEVDKKELFANVETERVVSFLTLCLNFNVLEYVKFFEGSEKKWGEIDEYIWHRSEMLDDEKKLPLYIALWNLRRAKRDKEKTAEMEKKLEPLKMIIELRDKLKTIEELRGELENIKLLMKKPETVEERRNKLKTILDGDKIKSLLDEDEKELETIVELRGKLKTIVGLRDELETMEKQRNKPKILEKKRDKLETILDGDKIKSLLADGDKIKPLLDEKEIGALKEELKNQGIECKKIESIIKRLRKALENGETEAMNAAEDKIKEIGEEMKNKQESLKEKLKTKLGTKKKDAWFALLELEYDITCLKRGEKDFWTVKNWFLGWKDCDAIKKYTCNLEIFKEILGRASDVIEREKHVVKDVGVSDRKEIVIKSLEEWGLPEKGHPNAFKRVVGDFYCMKKPVQMFGFDKSL